MELPLPSNVSVSKLLTSSDRDSAGASGCSSYRRDTKPPVAVSEYGSSFKGKKTDADLYLHEITSFKCEENDRRLHLGEVDKLVLPLPKHDGKPVNKKSLKRLSSFPCIKRPRADPHDDSIATPGADDYGKKIRYDHGRCTYDEKVRLVKQKRGQDNKRTDKKILRACPLTSKAGFTTSDSVSGGNNILGIYGLNTDLRDVTKHVEELSLNELLGGNYRYPNVFSEKGKRMSNANENILLSVKKAFSVLPLNNAADVNRKASVILSDPPVSLGSMSDGDEKGKSIEDLLCKVHDSCQTNLSDTICQPREILERLALPPSQDLDSLILCSSMKSVPSQSTVCMKSFRSASLPPFAWSFSHSGTFKPGLDAVKLASTRNTCQGKWLRIGSYSTSRVDEHNYFSNLELKTPDHQEDSIDKQKIDDLLQDVKRLTEAKLPPDGPRIVLESQVVDNTNVIIGSDASGFSISRKLKLVDAHLDSSDSLVEYGSKVETSGPEVALRCRQNDIKLVDPSGQKEHHSCSGSSYSSLCTSSAGGCGPSSWQSSMPDTGHSPRLLAAATILHEMSRCSNSVRNLNDNGGRMKWSKAPLPITMKSCKSITSLEKPDRLFVASRHHDPIKPTDLSMKQKEINEKRTDFTHTSNPGREPVRWSFSGEGSGVSEKPERVHLTVNQKLLHGSSVKPLGLMSSPARVGKAYDDQQKLRKAALKASSAAFGGTYIKDWSRGRSKRV